VSEGVKALLLDAGGTQDTVESLAEINGTRMVALFVAYEGRIFAVVPFLS
jgi:hypothetical protein